MSVTNRETSSFINADVIPSEIEYRENRTLLLFFPWPFFRKTYYNQEEKLGLKKKLDRRPGASLSESAREHPDVRKSVELFAMFMVGGVSLSYGLHAVRSPTTLHPITRSDNGKKKNVTRT